MLLHRRLKNDQRRRDRPDSGRPRGPHQVSSFSQCDVILGDRLISQASATHPYRATIETQLNFYEHTLTSQFSTGLFYKDTASDMDSAVINNRPNRGQVRRVQFSAESREFHLMGRLHPNVFLREVTTELRGFEN